MQRRFIQCDVFSDVPLLGNGLAVVLDGAGLDDETMLRFARWTQQAETTFLLPPKDPRADYAVRIFSATREMPFAGHPTLGSCAAWLHAGGVPKHASVVVQEGMTGLVEILQGGPAPAFIAPSTRIAGMPEAELQRICGALDIGAGEVLNAVTLDNGVLRNVIELKDAARVLSLDANAVSLPEFEGVSVIGSYPSGSEATYETRNLTPASLAPEDPVTGSMNAAIAVWLKETGRLTDDIVIVQGTVMGRKGRVHVSHKEGRVLTGGHTAIVIEGTIDL
jgi:PhzF family phenazine biosynthesis protein